MCFPSDNESRLTDVSEEDSSDKIVGHIMGPRDYYDSHP